MSDADNSIRLQILTGLVLVVHETAGALPVVIP